MWKQSRGLASTTKGYGLMEKLLKPLKEVEPGIGVRRSKLYQLFADGTLETVTIGRRRSVPRFVLVESVARLREEQHR